MICIKRQSFMQAKRLSFRQAHLSGTLARLNCVWELHAVAPLEVPKMLRGSGGCAFH
jgi:hypothetical protein